MKVFELIRMLEHHDPHADVAVVGDAYHDAWNVTETVTYTMQESLTMPGYYWHDKYHGASRKKTVVIIR